MLATVFLGNSKKWEGCSFPQFQNRYESDIVIPHSVLFLTQEFLCFYENFHLMLKKCFNYTEKLPIVVNSPEPLCSLFPFFFLNVRVHKLQNNYRLRLQLWDFFLFLYIITKLCCLPSMGCFDPKFQSLFPHLGRLE